MNPALPLQAAAHPWIAALQGRLDALESALLQGDALAVERASEAVQAVLKNAPRKAELQAQGSTLAPQIEAAAQRFGLLRQAVLRAAAQGQRAVGTLLPHATEQPTYSRQSRLRGAGRAYLSA